MAKLIKVRSKSIGDKQATVKEYELLSLYPAYDDYDNSFDCVFKHELEGLREVLYYEYDKVHAYEKMRIEAKMPKYLSDDPAEVFGLDCDKEYYAYKERRRAWVDSKISDSAFFKRRFNDMWAEPHGYDEYVEILSISD